MIKIYGITLALIVVCMVIVGFYYLFNSIPLVFSLAILGILILSIVGLTLEVDSLLSKIKEKLSKLPKWLKKLLGVKK